MNLDTDFSVSFNFLLRILCVAGMRQECKRFFRTVEETELHNMLTFVIPIVLFFWRADHTYERRNCRTKLLLAFNDLVTSFLYQEVPCLFLE